MECIWLTQSFSSSRHQESMQGSHREGSQLPLLEGALLNATPLPPCKTSFSRYKIFCGPTCTIRKKMRTTDRQPYGKGAFERTALGKTERCGGDARLEWKVQAMTTMTGKEKVECIMITTSQRRHSWCFNFPAGARNWKLNWACEERGGRKGGRGGRLDLSRQVVGLCCLLQGGRKRVYQGQSFSKFFIFFFSVRGLSDQVVGRKKRGVLVWWMGWAE